MRQSSLQDFTQRVLEGDELSRDEACVAAGMIASPEVAEDDKAAFLSALSDRGETAAEIAGFALALRDRATDPGLSEWSGRAIDLCGTGGDHSGTFNISTAVAFVVASLGVPVIKHGNRSITSKSGSADLLAALGIRIELTPEQHRRMLAATNFTFLFAPAFHPAFKHIVPVRKRLGAQGKRTIFNLLGPLLNPARPAYQLIGVASEELVRPVSLALGELGPVAGLVVNGSSERGQGIDEATVSGPFLVRGCGRLTGVQTVFGAEDFGAAAAPLSALAGGGPEENAATLIELFAGRGPVAVRESIALNAALALWVAGRVESVHRGFALAIRALDDGSAAATLAAVRSATA
jgi:anthranilate phosphoribosyltransferase